MGDFHDIVIHCNGSQGKNWKAHKVVLASFSSVFKEMIKEQMLCHINGILSIYLRGVQYDELGAILDFMYQGEANISQDRLTSFLSLADDLKIEGLFVQHVNVSLCTSNILFDEIVNNNYLKLEKDSVSSDLDIRFDNIVKDYPLTEITKPIPEQVEKSSEQVKNKASESFTKEKSNQTSNGISHKHNYQIKEGSNEKQQKIKSSMKTQGRKQSQVEVKETRFLSAEILLSKKDRTIVAH